MSGRAFLDTNVLVYAVDNAEPEKRKLARALLSEAENIVISAQVLNEFYVTVTRKLRPAVEAETAANMVRRLARIPCIAVDAELVQQALRAGHRWQLSHWDSLVVEAARKAGCSKILTEDLATGAAYDGLVIENPFG